MWGKRGRETGKSRLTPKFLPVQLAGGSGQEPRQDDCERSRFGKVAQFNVVHAKLEVPVRHLSKELCISLEAVGIYRGFKPGEKVKKESMGHAKVNSKMGK